MCFRWFQQLSVVLLSVLLYGCAVPLLGGSSYSSNQPAGTIPPHSHYRHAHNAAADPDNVASADYFNNVPAAADSRDDLWTEIRADLHINHEAQRPEVMAQIAWFVHHQGYLDRTAMRAAPFMYYIYQEVKARNLPGELVLLPMLESAYNPFVSSSAGAAGLWQLEPATARTFGARQDWWYDGRRDIAASTKAALDYFSYLRSYFGGDWLLAIAAYDSGEGTVSSAVRRNARMGLGTDFWSLRLPSETESYVPRLLALAAIVNNPQAYGIHLEPIRNAPYLGQVEIASQITLERAAQLSGISLTELKILNPGYKKNTLSPHQPYRLLLPIDRIPVFKHNLLAAPPVQPPVPASEPATVPVQSLPIEEKAVEEKPRLSESRSTPHLVRITHRVKPGETLERIARLYKISPVELAHWNHLSEHAHVKPGMQLTVFVKEKGKENESKHETLQPLHKPHKISQVHTAHHHSR